MPGWIRVVFWVVAAVDALLSASGLYYLLGENGSDAARPLRALVVATVAGGAWAAWLAARSLATKDDAGRRHRARGTTVLLWLTATLNGVFFLVLFSTKIGAGDPFGYLVMFGVGGATAASVVAVRRRDAWVGWSA